MVSMGQAHPGLFAGRRPRDVVSCSARSGVVKERVLRLRVDAVGDVQRDAELSRPERVASGQPLNLLERMHREAARTLEPLFVAGSGERFQEGVAVARGAVAYARPLLESRRAGVPRQVGAREPKPLV